MLPLQRTKYRKKIPDVISRKKIKKVFVLLTTYVHIYLYISYVRTTLIVRYAKVTILLLLL